MTPVCRFRIIVTGQRKQGGRWSWWSLSLWTLDVKLKWVIMKDVNKRCTLYTIVNLDKRENCEEYAIGLKEGAAATVWTVATDNKHLIKFVSDDLADLNHRAYYDDPSDFDGEADRLWWRADVQLIFNISVHSNHRHIADLQPWEFFCFSFLLFRLLLQKELRSLFSLVCANLLPILPINWPMTQKLMFLLP